MSDIFCGISQATHKTLCEDTTDLSVFKIQLSSYYDLVHELKTYLNATELQRAQKYHFEKDRNQFIICRSLLKFILAQDTGLSVSEINIQIDKNKKPYLSSNKKICFNVSHSRDFALIAVSNHDVGIDIEFLNENFDFFEMMPSIFSTIEIETVLNAENKTHKFFKFWTRKEAIVKATGEGISDYLPLIPAIDGCHTVSSKLLNNFKNLQVLSFNLNDHYVASLALSTKTKNIGKLQIYNLPNSIEGLESFSS
nr:4'-phosphopantetheinyl transferase superfamily protein [uncultured Psychroserpens sp.]